MNALVVEDDEDLRFALTALLRADGIRVEACPTAADARRRSHEARFDVALVDLGLPDADGLALIGDFTRRTHAIPTVCMTGRGGTESVVAAMRAGAFDFLVKPTPSDQVVSSLRAAARRSVQNNATSPVVPVPLGSSPVWQDVLDLCTRIAAAPRAKVLVTGESGSGKDVIARYIHALSARRDHPCIAVNCACLSTELVEAELFGHEAGAFTGARARRKGVLELADRGTLFLDEIGELSLSMQAKLLRVLEERRFRRIGAETEIAVDVRFIFATNQPLRQRAESGLFRWDLYQRLAVFEIALPPVRERPGDARTLVEGLLAGIAHGLEIAPPQVDPAIWPLIEAYPWPGNVRELRNFLERATVMSNGVLDAAVVQRLLPPQQTTVPSIPLPGEPAPGNTEWEPVDLATATRTHCENVVRWAGGNISAAARQLGISRGALRRHLAGADT